MPTLNWIGKDAVVKHHHEVPFHLLKDVPDLGSGDPGAGNLVVRGDNLVALKAAGFSPRCFIRSPHGRPASTPSPRARSLP